MGNLRVAVVGSGNQGLIMAGALSLLGCDISLTDTSPFVANLDDVAKSGSILVQGPHLHGRAQLGLVTSDIGAAIEDREVVFFAVPAYAHESVVRTCIPHLESEQALIFISYFAALRLRGLIQRARPGLIVYLCEMLSCLFAGRKVSPDEAVIEKRKNGLPFSAFPASQTDSVIRLLSSVLNGLVPARNCLETSVKNINPLLHVPTTLLNLGWIEATKGGFDFYREAKTPAVLRLENAVDQEIQALCRRLDLPDTSLADLVASLYSSHKRLPTEPGTEALKVRNAPDSIEHRYLTEDIPYGLVPIVDLAKRFHVPVPTTEAIVNLSNIATGRDFWTTGVLLSSLDLAGTSCAEQGRPPCTWEEELMEAVGVYEGAGR